MSTPDMAAGGIARSSSLVRPSVAIADAKSPLSANISPRRRSTSALARAFNGAGKSNVFSSRIWLAKFSAAVASECAAGPVEQSGQSDVQVKVPFVDLLQRGLELLDCLVQYFWLLVEL